MSKIKPPPKFELKLYSTTGSLSTYVRSVVNSPNPIYRDYDVVYAGYVTGFITIPKTLSIHRRPTFSPLVCLK